MSEKHALRSLHAREILDSRGNPTLEIEGELEDGTRGKDSIPSGASRGFYEAWELRDGDPGRYGGKGVLRAVKNVNTRINQALKGADVVQQAQIDEILINLDGTPNKSNLGAQAILGASLVCARLAAAAQKKPLYQVIREQTTRWSKSHDYLMPVPEMNMVNGGSHGDWVTDLQEYKILPLKGKTFAEALETGVIVYHTLKKTLKSHGYNTGVGDEGGFAPAFRNGNEEPLRLFVETVANTPFAPGRDIVFGIDGAASGFIENAAYNLKSESLTRSGIEMIEWWRQLVGRYPIVTIEDGLAEDDWENWGQLTNGLPHTQLVGDDLFVTNTERLKKGIALGAGNAILVKPNQIGTLSETLNTIELAQANNIGVIISHRSGETTSTTIADLAVAVNAGQIKTGSPARSERVEKYNQLLRIEEQLRRQKDATVIYDGSRFRR